MDEFRIAIPLPTDENGLVGRACPSCGDYFKVKFGTGLPTELMKCPYCQHEEDSSEFITPEQAEYARSIGMREAMERVVKPLVRQFGANLEQMNRRNRNDLFSLQFHLREEWRPIPVARYLERELETDVKCDCTLEFAVFGVFATCPDCGQLNADVVFRKSLEAASKRLRLLEGTEDKELREAILSDTLGSVVGAFDAVGKALRNAAPENYPARPKNLFQNLDALSEMLESRGSSLPGLVGDERSVRLRTLFEVRHVIEHNLGVVDERAAERVPGLSQLVGRKYVLQRAEVEAFIEDVEAFFDAIQGMVGK